MSPTTSVRAASRLWSKCRRASASYLSEQERARIRHLRSRARKERDVVCKLRAQCTIPSARHLLKQALQTVDLVDRYFLSAEFLPERKAPAQFSKWFDFVEQCLVNAVKTREFYETMLERYHLTDTVLSNCAVRTLKARRQQRSRLAGSRAGNSSDAHLEVQTARRSRARGDDEVADSRPPTADARSISVWSCAASVRGADGSSAKSSCAKSRSNAVPRKTILTREVNEPPAAAPLRFRT
jgi:hypothetical protein